MLKKKKNKKAQVTIFIIIAILIIALGVLIYLFYPQVKSTIKPTPENPNSFIQTCLESDIKNNINKLSLQGGSLNPSNYIMYRGNKIEYLCYINEYYKPCVMQRPLLDAHIESEIKNSIKNKVSECFNSLKESYENKGYSVNLRPGNYSIELLPKRVITTLNYKLTLIKSDEDSESYDSFNVIINNNLYELVSIASSILNWEATYGDAETTLYMDAYHDLKVEKFKQTGGSTIYILTDRNTGNKFQFASRSVALPPGFG